MLDQATSNIIYKPVPSLPERAEKRTYSKIWKLDHVGERWHYHRIPSPEQVNKLRHTVIRQSFQLYSFHLLLLCVWSHIRVCGRKKGRSCALLSPQWFTHTLCQFLIIFKNNKTKQNIVWYVFNNSSYCFSRKLVKMRFWEFLVCQRDLRRSCSPVNSRHREYLVQSLHWEQLLWCS